MTRLQWSTEALDDLDRIDAFNLTRSEAWAMRVQRRIGERCRSLLQLRFQGRPIADATKRRVSITDVQYVVDYEVLDDAIRILRVRSTRENRDD